MKSNLAGARIFDAVFGYDFFISYAWKDGGPYAAALHRKLTNQGFTVFLDREDFAVGDHWSLLARRAVRKTKQLVLVGTPCIHLSKPVMYELSTFSQTARRIIPIELQSTFDFDRHPDSPLRELLLEEILRLKSDNGEVIPEGPSDEIVAELRRGFKHIRQTTFRVRLLATTSLLLLTFALAASGFAYMSQHNLTRALTGEADAQTNAKTADANAKKAEEERKRAVETLSASDFETGTRLLEEDRPGEGVTYLARAIRGWKQNRPATIRLYNYIASTGHLLPVCAPLRHKAEVVSASFSPDDKLVLTASRDGSAVLWKRDSGEAAFPPLKHKGPVTSAVFSPDGKLVLTSSEDHTARLWTTATGAGAMPPLQHGAPVASGAFSPDGRVIATVTREGEVSLWNSSDGKRQAFASPPRTAGKEVSSLCFSSDGKHLLTLSRDGAQIWNLKDKLKAGPHLSGGGYTNSAVFSVNGKTVLTASDDSTVQQWDISTGKAEGEPLKHNSFANSVSVVPFGSSIVTASNDGAVCFWNPAEAKLLGKFRPTGLAVRSVSCSLDGQWVAAVDDAGTVQLYDTIKAQEHANALLHEAFVTTARFSNDSRYLVTATSGGVARIWHVRPQQAMPLTLHEQTSVDAVTFLPEGNRLLVGGNSLWSLESGQQISLAPIPGTEAGSESAAPTGLSKDPAGQGIVATGKDDIARLWQGSDGSFLRTLFKGLPIKQLLTSQDGRAWATVSPEGNVQRWDATGNSPLGEPVPCKAEDSMPTLSPGGRFLLLARDLGEGHGSVAEVWDTVANKQIMPPITLAGKVFDVGFSRDERFFGLASGSQVKIWDLPGGQDTGLQIHYRWNAYGPLFGQDSDLAITHSEDGSLNLWDVLTRRPGIKLHFDPEVLRVMWLPGDELFATASWDNSGRIWHAKTGLPLSGRLRHEKSLEDEAISKMSRQAGVFTFEYSGDRDHRPNRAYASSGEQRRITSGVFAIDASSDQRLVATGGTDGCARVWDVTPPGGEAPEWLAPLAEGLVGRRINAANGLEQVPTEELIHTLEECRRQKSSSGWDNFARWMTAAPNQRTIAPWSKILVYDELLKEAQWLARKHRDSESEMLIKRAEFFDETRHVRTSKTDSLEQLLAQERSNARLPEGVGFLYGSDHLVTFKAPEGWVLDNSVLRDSGIHAAFYAKGETFESAPAFMYVVMGPARKQGLEGIAQEAAKFFKSKGAELKVLTEERNTPIIAKPHASISYVQISKRATAYEKVIYIPEGPLLLKIVCTSQSKDALLASEPQFVQLAQSYRLLTHRPSEEVLEALRDGNMVDFLKLLPPLLREERESEK